MKYPKMFYILISCCILIFLEFAQNVCFAKVNASAVGPFSGSILIKLVDVVHPSSGDLFELSLKDGIRPIGQSRIIREGEEKWNPVNERFRGRYDEYKTREKKIVSVLERNLNKNNISRLREIVTKDFEILGSDRVLKDRFVDIRSQQDGTVLKNVLLSTFHPNSQLTYAVYGTVHPLLIDLV